MILPMTLTMAAASVLLNIWLAQRVGLMRRAHKVSIGDGGAEPLTARMRAQANFVEWAPFFLILVAGIELARGEPIWLWVVCALFMIVRILHAFGMDRPPGNKFRMIGIVATLLIMLGLSLYAIILVYQDQMERVRPAPHITYMAARAST
jgi:uncharacterized membrane protein YecN with MAPEG domain